MQTTSVVSETGQKFLSLSLAVHRDRGKNLNSSSTEAESTTPGHSGTTFVEIQDLPASRNSSFGEFTELKSARSVRSSSTDELKSVPTASFNHPIHPTPSFTHHTVQVAHNSFSSRPFQSLEFAPSLSQHSHYGSLTEAQLAANAAFIRSQPQSFFLTGMEILIVLSFLYFLSGQIFSAKRN